MTNQKIINLFFISFLFILFTLNTVLAANIHGKIYSFDLQKLNDVIIEINTTPKQTLVSKDGEYSLDVTKGTYILKAIKRTGSNTEKTEEIISVTEENGEFNIDLFLITDIKEEEIFEIESELDKLTEYNTDFNIKIIISSVLILILIIIFLIFKNKSKKKTNSEKNKESPNKEMDIKKSILDAIEKSDGRTTQKELRKIIPYSESKISIVLAELESEEKIKKIKKGRGNIIILNR